MAMSIAYALTKELDTYTPCILDEGNNPQQVNFHRLVYLIWSILKTSTEHFNKEQQEKILEALRFAATQHKGIYREDTFTPYLLHVLEVVSILIGENVFDYSCLVAAIIHDVVEDTGAKIKEIKKRFGSVIARIVDLLSKHKNTLVRKAYWWRMRNEWNENIRWRAIVIKFADRIHNLMTLDVMPEESKKRKIEETILEFPFMYEVLVKTLRKLRRKGVIQKEYYVLLPFQLNNRLAHELSHYQ
jgi:(p)ppGpp synthase/HD superfamily hydrolase